MTHKKFLILRLIGLKIIIAVAVLLICGVLVLLNAGSQMTVEKLTPIIIVAGILGVVLTLLFGRIFCGFICPLGFIFDIIWRITEALHLPKIPRNEKFMKVINILNIIFLCFFICGISSLFAIAIFSPEILSKVKIPIFIPIIIVAFMIAINSLDRRFFCNVCPIGTFVGLFYKLNIVKLEKDCGLCTMCGACYEACPMRIKSIYIETKKSNISNLNCLYCGECIKQCPEDDALSITICKKKVYKSSRDYFMKNQFFDVAVNKKGDK